MEAILVALIVGAMGIFGQYALKRQDYQRQDEVARQVERASAVQIEAAAEAKAASLRAEASASKNEAAVERVHLLSNQRLSDEIAEKLGAYRGELRALGRLPDPSAEDRARISMLTAQIANTEATLAARDRATAAGAGVVEAERGDNP